MTLHKNSRLFQTIFLVFKFMLLLNLSLKFVE